MLTPTSRHTAKVNQRNNIKRPYESFEAVFLRHKFLGRSARFVVPSKHNRKCHGICKHGISRQTEGMRADVTWHGHRSYCQVQVYILGIRDDLRKWSIKYVGFRTLSTVGLIPTDNRIYGETCLLGLVFNYARHQLKPSSSNQMTHCCLYTLSSCSEHKAITGTHVCLDSSCIHSFLAKANCLHHEINSLTSF